MTHAPLPHPVHTLSRALVALIFFGCSCGADRGKGAGPAAPTSGAAPASADSSANAAPAKVVEKPAKGGVGRCADGIDNDGDGLVDWQLDLGCFGPSDDDEGAATLELENGFSTFDPSRTSRIVFVSSSGGDDARDGASPATAVKSLARGAELVREQENDFLLLKRGDTWREEWLGRFKSGKSRNEPLVVASYGDSHARPRLETSEHFLNTNGRVRNYLAILGLEIVSVGKKPGDPAFDGGSDGGLRFVGGGESILVEDCLLSYAGLSVQSYGGEVFRDVRVRRNVILRNYHADTCGTGPKYRPSGFYTSAVENLLVEDNFFDHNGWNPEEVPSACATKFNHNLYLNGTQLVLRNNVMARASSIGLKLVSAKEGGAARLEVAGNVFFQGEIGITVGGNANTPRRFINVRIHDNAFVQLGETNPTGRELAWGIDVRDNVDTIVERNVFLEQTRYKNSFGVRIAGDTQHDVTIKDNLFWQLSGRAIHTIGTSQFESVVVSGNRIVAGERACAISHEGDKSAARYSGNSYQASAGELRFCVGKERAEADVWKAEFEPNATFGAGSAVPPPSWAAYLASLGLGPDAAHYLEALQGRFRFAWNERLAASSAVAFLMKPPASASGQGSVPAP